DEKNALAKRAQIIRRRSATRPHRGSLLYRDDDNRCVVVEAFFTVKAYGFHDRSLNFLGGSSAILQHDLFHTLHPELFIVTALHFGDAIRVKNQPIAALKP